MARNKPTKEEREMYMWFLDIFDVRESRYLPDAVMEKVLTNDVAIYDKYLEKYPDLEKETLSEFFQTYFGERDFLKQEFTPNGVAQLVNELIHKGRKPIKTDDSLLDECAGVGSLIIPEWVKNPNVFVFARELSSATIPFLLFNLALRNIHGVVIEGDTLSLKYSRVFILNKGKKYSHITEIDLKKELERIDPLILTNFVIRYRGLLGLQAINEEAA